MNAATTNYVLDLNAGLTQVLSDGNNTYLYGNGRVGEQQPSGFVYHLGDALGSMRQLVDGSANVTRTRNYEPFGKPLFSGGTGNSVFGFAGEQWDANTNLLYLRARFYNVDTGRFFQRDIWNGDPYVPMSYNLWLYVYSDPLNHTDPSGLCAPLNVVPIPKPEPSTPRQPPKWIPSQYNREAAVIYARQYASQYNPAFVSMFASDCTNYASQVICAGGLQMDEKEWFYRSGTRRGCGAKRGDCSLSWSITDELLNYLRDKRRFQATTVKLFQGRSSEGQDANFGGCGIIGAGELFNTSRIQHIRKGDLVFMRQDLGYTGDPNYYNHLAVVIGWGPRTFITDKLVHSESVTPPDESQMRDIPAPGLIPWVLDHSGYISNNVGGWPHGVTDARAGFLDLTFVHIPDHLPGR